MALELQKEQVLLAGTLAVLGLLYWKGSSAEAGGGVRPSRAKRASEELALARHAAPDTTLAERRSRPVPAEARDLFAPPRDTRPLAPLSVAPPPLAALSALRPPAEPGPAPAHFGRFLRADASVVPVPGLFAAADEAPDEEPDGELLEESHAASRTPQASARAGGARAQRPLARAARRRARELPRALRLDPHQRGRSALRAHREPRALRPGAAPARGGAVRRARSRRAASSASRACRRCPTRASA